jgi:hypothetical protein
VRGPSCPVLAGLESSGTLGLVASEDSRTGTASRLIALLLPSFTPAAILAWVAVSMSGASWGIVFLPLAFGAIWASRPPVDRYLASLETPPRVWEGLVQFTPGYFAFHSRRAAISAMPFWTVFVVLAATVVLGWSALAVGAFFDLAWG